MTRMIGRGSAAANRRRGNGKRKVARSGGKDRRGLEKGLEKVSVFAALRNRQAQMLADGLPDRRRPGGFRMTPAERSAG